MSANKAIKTDVRDSVYGDVMHFGEQYGPRNN